MSETTTLRTLSGLPSTPASLADSTLVMIDCQNTYIEGVMALDGVSAALDEAAKLLERARSAGIPIVHIQHDSGVGSPYDVHAEIGQIAGQVAPQGSETVIVKQFPNAFVQTELHERLQATSAHHLLLTGFMTHMCVNSTARGAFNLGYAPTVIAGATATRALPGTTGEVPAAALQAASLAGLADLFAIVVPDGAAIPD